MKLDIEKINGKKANKKADLKDDIFSIEPNDHAIWLDVTRYLNNQRQGTHKTKERAEIKGSRTKLRRQKGSGFARVGDTKSPIFRGGGNVFGPKPKKYNKKINKKTKSLARKSALTYKAKKGGVRIVEDVKLDEPKTKKIVDLLKNLDLHEKKTLIIVPEKTENLRLASRNIKNVKVMRADDINTYDILNASSLIICESSVEKIHSILN
ncbi:MAG: 50S ribosomal protein L4 [Flavobacteriales bacterium]